MIGPESAADQTIEIRAALPEDATWDAVARLNAAVPRGERHDFEPRTPAALRELDAVLSRDGRVLRRYVAEVVDTGAIVAYAHGFHMPWDHHPARFWCSVRCDPAYRRRGIGRRLFTALERDLDRLGAAELRAMVPEARPDMGALMTNLGFHELFRSWDFELDLAQPGPGPLPAVPPPGVAVVTLPEERARQPACLADLRALYLAVSREVPLPNHADPELPAEAFAAYLERWPTSLPEACFIAREGDTYLGLCILHRSAEDPACLDHLFTGVAPKGRGRGVATALKLSTITFARRHGYARISTAVESNNPGMLALNERLGFVRRGGLIVLARQGKPALRNPPSAGPAHAGPSTPG
ncbi:N-acetyltransferase family protein [Sorangium sp. So ce131]|uniref:GNAT family N-acetyltransferase n=1 Tax=Sorangium sp. So ce131 TaxID=3133282 RepID=UPI003F5ED2C3